MHDMAALFTTGEGYLNAATMGLPPRRTTEVLHDAIQKWAHGQASAAGYGDHVSAARTRYAALVEVDPALVAVGSQVSVFAGMLAQSLPPGSEVLCVENDFTSIIYPFLVREASGITVRFAPLAGLADAVSERTTLVSYSLVQSACGSVADMAAVSEAAARVGARTLVDTTQAAGWMPVDAGAADWTVCGGYKWLCQPRGTAFLTARAEHLHEVTPVNAGWCAAEDPWGSVYGSRMHLAPDARRFDVSPAWLSWVGAASALEVLAQVGVERIHAHDVALADAFRDGLGLPASASAIVSLAVDGAAEALAAAGVRCAVRAGRVRLAFHLWNTLDDVATVLHVLHGLRAGSKAG